MKIRNLKPEIKYIDCIVCGKEYTESFPMYDENYDEILGYMCPKCYRKSLDFEDLFL